MADAPIDPIPAPKPLVDVGDEAVLVLPPNGLLDVGDVDPMPAPNWLVGLLVLPNGSLDPAEVDPMPAPKLFVVCESDPTPAPKLLDDVAPAGLLVRPNGSLEADDGVDPIPAPKFP